MENHGRKRANKGIRGLKVGEMGKISSLNYNGFLEGKGVKSRGGGKSDDQIINLGRWFQGTVVNVRKRMS